MSELDQEKTKILEAFKSVNLKRIKVVAQTQEQRQEYAEALFKKDARSKIWADIARREQAQ